MGSAESHFPTDRSLRTEVTKSLKDADTVDVCPLRDCLLCAGSVGIKMLLGLVKTINY